MYKNLWSTRRVTVPWAALCLIVMVVFTVYTQDSTGIAAGTVITAPAAEKKDSSPVADLDRMTVIGSRYESLMAEARSVARINPDSWTGTGNSLGDIIASQTGIQTRRFGGRGSYQTVSIRGAEGQEVLVLLDGIPLNNPMGGAVDLGRINPLQLSGIEVYRGMIPARFGGNGMGGVINLRSGTSSGAEKRGGEFHSKIGNYGAQEHAVSFHHTPDSTVFVSGEVLYEQCDNTFPYLDRNNTLMGTVIDPTLDDTERVMENNQYFSGAVSVHPVVHFSGGRSLYSHAQLSFARINQPAEEGKENHTAYYEEKRTGFSARLDEIRTGALALVPALGMHYRVGTRFSSSIDESVGGAHATFLAHDSYRETGSREKSISLPLTLYYTPGYHVGVEAQVAAGGADIEPVRSANAGMHGNWHSREAYVNGAADVAVTLGQLSFRLSGGGKGIYSTTDGGFLEALQKSVETTDTITGIWSAGAGLSWRLRNDAILLFVNGGRYSNQPSLQQRYGARGAYNPNPSLRPETGYNGELGVKYNTRSLYAEITGFYNRSHDKIITLFDGRQLLALNCSGTRVAGVESHVHWKPFNLVSVESAITYQRAVNLSRQYNWYGRQLPNEPDLTLRESVTAGPWKNLSLRYGIQLKSYYYRSPANNRWSDRVPRLNSDGTGDYFELFHNAVLTWNATRFLTVRVSAVNVTNQLLTQGELAVSTEGDYSWVLYPANQCYFSMEYSF